MRRRMHTETETCKHARAARAHACVHARMPGGLVHTNIRDKDQEGLPHLSCACGAPPGRGPCCARAAEHAKQRRMRTGARKQAMRARPHAGDSLCGAQDRAALHQGGLDGGRAVRLVPAHVQDAAHGGGGRHAVQGQAHPRVLPLVSVRWRAGGRGVAKLIRGFGGGVCSTRPSSSAGAATCELAVAGGWQGGGVAWQGQGGLRCDPGASLWTLGPARCPR